jgi:phosphomannomutase
VLSYTLEGNAGLIVRPSGTEPKIKGYVTAIGATPEEAASQEAALLEQAKALLQG